MTLTLTGSCRISSRRKSQLVLLILVAMGVPPARGQSTVLQFDPAHTAVKFTLGDVLHTVRGSFQIKRGEVQFDPSLGNVAGEIVIDARSGVSGNGMRDRKMHKEVLESERYPEIIFRPDRIEGSVAAQGKSSVKVHGIFRLHGTDHEILVPADVEMAPDHWTAMVRFTIPYVRWGLKNPSTLFLRVNDSVEIDVAASGSLSGRSARGADQ
jgi:polyisoprenoid-binding protein YceI